jgi:MFS family permease
MGGLLFGYDIGATSAVLTQLESSKYSGVTWNGIVDQSALLQGLITSISMAGALLGSLITFQVADQLGRRKELLLVRTCALMYVVLIHI